MNMLLALILALVATGLVIFLCVFAAMAWRARRPEAVALREALGDFGNVWRGQMKDPSAVPPHQRSGGLLWNSQDKKYEPQSSLSEGALHSVLLKP